MNTGLCCSVLGFVLVGAIPFSGAQEPLNLVVKREISVDNEKATVFVSPIVTDADGNMYVRYSDGQHPADAINKITTSGKKLPSLNLANVPDLAEAKIVDFSVFEGGLVVLAREGGFSLEEVTYVAVFTSDGALQMKTKVGADIHASQIAALASNRFVVAGRAPWGRLDHPGSDWTPKTAVLNDAGQVIEVVRLEHDVAPIERDKRTAANGAVRRDRDFEVSLAASTMTTGDDGNVYLMRYGRSGIVFVISPNGTVAHRFELESPSNSSLREIKVAKHKIAALFVRGKPDAYSETAVTFVRTYDANSGKLLSNYVLDPRIPDLMAAYDGNTGFTFFGPEAVDARSPEEADRIRIFEVGPK